jgi:molecular chaperone DnaK
VEKALNENRAKLSDADVKAVEGALADARKALEEGGAERITKATDALNQVSNKAFESMYRSASGQSGGGNSGGPGGPGGAGGAGAQGESKPDGDVIDAEYVDGDDRK